MSLPKIGFIGIGIMGRSMAGHLLKAGYPITVFTRTKTKADSLLQQGAQWAESPAQIAKNSDVVITIVGYPTDVESVYFGPNGILDHMKAGGLTIDMTTSSPALAQKIYEQAALKKISALDAPVSGGDLGAREARLSIMVGGDPDAFERAKPILSFMGKNISHQGPAGSGQKCKLTNQTMIAGLMIGVCEGLFYAQKSGLNLESVISTLSQGAAGSWTLNNLAPRIVKKDFEPGFMIEHFVKDMKLVMEDCKRMNIQLKGLELVHQLYESIQKQGYGRKGTQSLILALQEKH